jgi:hypothetical protein
VESTSDIDNMLVRLKLMAAFEEEFQAFILDVDQALLIKVRERRKQEGLHAVTAPGLEPLVSNDESALAEHDIPAPTVESKGVDQRAIAVEEERAGALRGKKLSGNGPEA